MLSPNDILEQSAVPGPPSGRFVLGAHSDRLTLWSQQVRALNLAYAIRATHTRRLTVGVVGAGVGGVTLASALALGGHDVIVLERETRPLHLYADAHHRWVHPRVLDWPGFESLGHDARLPIYNWYASDAATVTRRWRAEWHEFRNAMGDRLNVACRVGAIEFERIGQRYELRWTDPRGARRSENADCVVLCVGYGTDHPRGDFRIANGPYWTPDGLSHASTDGAVLVSGTGDGGIIDLFRACLHDFDTAYYLSDVVDPYIDAALYDELRSLEQDLDAISDDEFVSFYQRLRVDAIVEGLESRVRSDTSCVLNGLAPHCFSARASALNRFLLSQLRHTEAFRYVPGRLQSIAGRAGRWAVTIAGTDHEFDHVVVRHGPDPELEKGFASVAVELAAAGRRGGGRDPMRDVNWPEGFFDVSRLPWLEAAIRRATGRVQPPDEGDLYAGGTLFLEFGEQFVPLPPEVTEHLTFEDERGRRRHFKFSPTTRRRIRQHSDLPRHAVIYQRT